MFQGGFVGIECDLSLVTDSNLSKSICKIFPADVNNLQYFKLESPIVLASDQKLEIQFNQSSDFYGRITVYMIEFGGEPV